MDRLHVPYIETMISQACTLSCKGCTNYSDYNVKRPVLTYKEYCNWFDPWWEKIEFDVIGFIGGEPMINPELKDFLYKTQRKTEKCVMLVTNATLWHKWPGFMDFLKDTGDVILKFSVHQPNAPYMQKAIQEVLDSLPWERTHSDHDFIENYECKEYRLNFQIDRTTAFLKTWKGNSYLDMKPYNSNPGKAFSICSQSHCPLLYNGRLYKCSSIAMLENVLTDHNRHQDPDWQDYLTYKGVGPNDDYADIVDWASNYAKPHKICKMCPEPADKPYIPHIPNVKSRI